MPSIVKVAFVQEVPSKQKKSQSKYFVSLVCLKICVNIDSSPQKVCSDNEDFMSADCQMNSESLVDMLFLFLIQKHVWVSEDQKSRLDTLNGDVFGNHHVCSARGYHSQIMWICCDVRPAHILNIEGGCKESMPSVLNEVKSERNACIRIMTHLNLKSSHIYESVRVSSSSQLNGLCWLRVHIKFQSLFAVQPSAERQILIVSPI